MSIALMKKTKYALIVAMAAIACALFALPGMAFASTNVTVNYTNAAGATKSTCCRPIRIRTATCSKGKA